MYIAIYEDGGGLELIEDLPKREPTCLKALWDRHWERFTVYSPQGVKYSVKVLDAIPKKSLLRTIMVHTFHNPVKDVSLACHSSGSFSLDELKRGVLECIENDDDILTQFFTRTEIAEALGQADSFEKVVALLKQLETGDDVGPCQTHGDMLPG